MDNNLEDTKALNELENLNKENEEKLEETMVFDPINEEESQEELYNNLVSTEDTKEFSEEDKVVEEEKIEDLNKKSLKDKWHNLSKKKKIIIIVSAILVLALIILLIVFLVKPKNTDSDTMDGVVIQKDNYIYQNGKLVLLDSDDNTIGEYVCNNKDADLCYVAYLDNANDSFISSKNTYEDGSLIKSRAPIYLDKYAFIVDQDSKNAGVIFFYDIENKNVINEYKSVKAYSLSNNYVVIENKNSEFGLFEIEDSGLKELIPFKYSYMGINRGDTNKVVAKDTNGYLLLSFSGSALSKAISQEIVDYNDTLIVTSNMDKYSVYSYEGNEYQNNLDFVRLIDKSYYAYVNKGQLFIKDTDNNKYNEEGYDLKNDKYIPVNIFDKDNKKIKTEESFNIELNGNTLNIKIGDKTEQLSLLDGEASKNYTHYSYFAGKLYFYSDDNKTNLIGSYTCNNKNDNIKNNTFENCYVAKDSTFSSNYKNLYKDKDATIPLFNNKYVFIYDGPTLANEDNMEIKFYDLSQNKVLGTYSAIDADIADNKGKFELVSTSDKEIIAKSKGKDGKFGTISINSDSAKVNYKFEYDALERYGKYFIAQKEDEYWVVLYKENETSYDFNGKIMNDNDKYFVIKNEDDDDVMIYPNDKKAKPLIDKSFRYIVLDEVLYAAVDSSNKLWLYKYDSKTPINEKGIKLDDHEYYSADVEDYPFTLNYNSSKTKVKVYSLDGNDYELEDEFNIGSDKED